MLEQAQFNMHWGPLRREANPMKYARTERERRFLLPQVPRDLPSQYRRIRDWYIEGTRLRLRRVEDPAGNVLDLKIAQKYSEPAGPGLCSTITNLYLAPGEYDLLRTLGGRPIVKRRYQYLHAQHGFSVDVFEQALQGLVLAEIKFSSDEAAALLPMPEFAVADVTAEPFFTGGVLAAATPEQLERELARWGCQRTSVRNREAH